MSVPSPLHATFLEVLSQLLSPSLEQRQLAEQQLQALQVTEGETWSRGAKRNKLGNVWVFVQLIYGPGWSTNQLTETQTLPNLVLAPLDVYHCPREDV